ncbi:MAG: hypothetical protein ACXIUM_12645 [Wenzhouxiangella sp.]
MSPLIRKLLVMAYAALLSVLLVIAGAQWYGGGTPALPAFGLMLTASSPLVFLLWASRSAAGSKQHPVMVSASMGLGCVCIMIGIQRFGEQHQWLLVLALVALVGWMVYQRYIWRQQATPEHR